MLDFYTIYDHPLDHPGEFVCRRWTLQANRADAAPGPIVARGPTLAIVRAQLPTHLVNIGRYAADDPAIAEVWI